MDGKAEELWRELCGVAGTVLSLEGGLRRVLGLGPLIRPLGGRWDTLCGHHLWRVSVYQNKDGVEVKGEEDERAGRERKTDGAHPTLCFCILPARRRAPAGSHLPWSRGGASTYGPAVIGLADG